MKGNISPELLDKFRAEVASPVHEAVRGAVARVGIREVAIDNEAVREHRRGYSIETKMGEITSQKQSGRCWMFAALNVARVKVMEKYNLKNFEFSQTYTIFWDKLEKANYFLESIIKTADKPANSRLVSHLLQTCTEDGGQWAMFSGLLAKYGSVPKEAMPETFHSSCTTVFNLELGSYLRFFASELRDFIASGASEEQVRAEKDKMLQGIYGMLEKAFGKVPEHVEFAYRDKDTNEYHRMPKMTPQEFFAETVGWKLEDKVSLINAPTADKPFGHAYTVDFLGSVIDAPEIKYINVEIDELKKAAIASMKAGIPVWFGCDVGKISTRDTGIMDLDAYAYDRVWEVERRWTKAKRLDYGQSLLTHAMVLTGVDLDDDGKPRVWKVENSWSKDVGNKGVFSMSDAWFDEFVYQVMVDREFIEAEILKALDEPVTHLDPWDPMGALA